MSGPPDTRPASVAHALIDFALSRLNRDALASAIGEEISRVTRLREIPFRTVVISMAAASSILTVGFIAWLLRGGALLGAFLSSLPLWRGFDPLMVVLRPRGRDKIRNPSDVDAMFGAGRASARSPAGLMP